MPEPTVPAVTVPLIAPAITVPVVTVMGVSLGLRPDILVAGFAGAVVAMTLLNSVPSSGDTWQRLLRDSMRRMAVALASSVTAGYLTPLALLVAQIPESLLLGVAFAVGAGAQRMLLAVLHRLDRSVSGRHGADPAALPGAASPPHGPAPGGPDQ